MRLILVSVLIIVGLMLGCSSPTEPNISCSIQDVSVNFSDPVNPSGKWITGFRSMHLDFIVTDGQFTGGVWHTYGDLDTPHYFTLQDVTFEQEGSNIYYHYDYSYTQSSGDMFEAFSHLILTLNAAKPEITWDDDRAINQDGTWG